MKATDVVRQLKSELGVGRNDEIVPAVRALLEQKKAAPPMAALLIMDESGTYFPHLVGMGQPSAKKLAMMRAGCEGFAAQLGPQLDRMREKEIEARVRAELAKRDNGAAPPLDPPQGGGDAPLVEEAQDT